MLPESSAKLGHQRQLIPNPQPLFADLDKRNFLRTRIENTRRSLKYLLIDLPSLNRTEKKLVLPAPHLSPPCPSLTHPADLPGHRVCTVQCCTVLYSTFSQLKHDRSLRSIYFFCHFYHISYLNNSGSPYPSPPPP